MSKLSKFLKGNKVKKENTTYAATASLLDEKGKPLLWTIRPISTKETEDIRESCMIDVQVVGKPGQFRQKINSSKYMAKIIAASVVEPDLHDKELQDSYGVMNPEDLLLEMVDDPGEYTDFIAFIQKFSGLNTTMQEKVDEAKN